MLTKLDYTLQTRYKFLCAAVTIWSTL